MRMLTRTVLRTTAIALGLLATTIGSTPARAECFDGHRCGDGDEEDICYVFSGSKDFHCHINHGVCSEGSGGSCEPVEG